MNLGSPQKGFMPLAGSLTTTAKPVAKIQGEALGLGKNSRLFSIKRAFLFYMWIKGIDILVII